MAFITHVGKLRREKAMRENRDISQRGMAKEIGIAADTVNRWENNQVEQIDFATATKLADYFEVALSELVELPKKAKKPAATWIGEQP